MNFVWVGLLKKNKKLWGGNNLNVKSGEIVLIVDYYVVFIKVWKECLMIRENVYNRRYLKMRI